MLFLRQNRLQLRFTQGAAAMTSIATTVIGLVGAVMSPLSPHAATPARAYVAPEAVALCAARSPMLGAMTLSHSASTSLVLWSSPAQLTAIAPCDTSQQKQMTLADAEISPALSHPLTTPKAIATPQVVAPAPAQRASNATLAYTQPTAQKPAVVAQPAIRQAADASGLCSSDYYVAGSIGSWVTPPGCFAGIYSINPNDYVYRPGFGACNWWPEVLHPNYANVTMAARHSQPIDGAAVYFGPGVQGAGSAGHYAEVEAVLNNGWLLVSEMNFYWRGGGWGKVDFRYVNYYWGGMTFLY